MSTYLLVQIIKLKNTKIILISRIAIVSNKYTDLPFLNSVRVKISVGREWWTEYRGGKIPGLPLSVGNPELIVTFQPSSVMCESVYRKSFMLNCIKLKHKSLKLVKCMNIIIILFSTIYIFF